MRPPAVGRASAHTVAWVWNARYLILLTFLGTILSLHDPWVSGAGLSTDAALLSQVGNLCGE